MYAPPAPGAGSPYAEDDFAWLELCNTATASINLEGVSFDVGIIHTFTPFMLAPGARLVLVKNLAAFATRYPTNPINVIAWTSGNLARAGETLSLVDPGASNILAFTYSRVWYPMTFNAGSSLVAVDLAAAEPLWSTSGNWRPSRAASGASIPSEHCATIRPVASPCLCRPRGRPLVFSFSGEAAAHSTRTDFSLLAAFSKVTISSAAPA